jgi:hypothetical protein
MFKSITKYGSFHITKQIYFFLTIDFNFTPHQLTNLVNDNPVETQIVQVKYQLTRYTISKSIYIYI